MAPVYEKVKSYLTEFIKKLESEPDKFEGIISLQSLNEFFERFGECASSIGN